MTNKLHFIWIDGDVPSRVLENVQQWRNMGYVVKLWTDSDIDSFGIGPWKDLNMLPAQKVDFLRIKVIQKFGGWYIDSDCLPGKITLPLNEKVFLASFQGSHVITNAVFYAPQAHPFLQYWFETLLRNLTELSDIEIINISGPYALRSALYGYLQLVGRQTFKSQIQFLTQDRVIHIPYHLRLIGSRFLIKRSMCIHRADASWKPNASLNQNFPRLRSIIYMFRMVNKFRILDSIRNYLVFLRNIKLFPKSFLFLILLSKFDLEKFSNLNHDKVYFKTIDKFSELTQIQTSQCIDLTLINDKAIAAVAEFAGWRKLPFLTNRYIRQHFKDI